MPTLRPMFTVSIAGPSLAISDVYRAFGFGPSYGSTCLEFDTADESYACALCDRYAAEGFDTAVFLAEPA